MSKPKYTPQEIMKDLNTVTHHGAKYEYRTNSYNDHIINRDAFSLMDKVGGSLFMTLVDQAIPKTDKFFITHSSYSKDNQALYGTSFRRLTMEDVRTAILIQIMILSGIN